MSIIARVGMLIASVIIAILTTALYVMLVWRLDRYEREPIKLLVGAFVWGALPAVILAAVIEIAFDMPLVALGFANSSTISASFIAPPVEEILKALALLGLYAMAHNEFDGVLDGIVYGSIIGFGFAMTENVFYYWSATASGRIGNWLTVVLIRSVPFGFTHAMFTSCTGVGLGMARYTRSRKQRWVLFLLGLAMAIAAHAVHNLMLSIDGLCFISLLSDWLGITVLLVIVALAWRRERLWIRTYLPEEVVAGRLTQEQFAALTSRQRRAGNTWHLLGAKGTRAASIWRKLAQSATELAFAKHRYARMGDEKGNVARIEALRAQVSYLADQYRIMTTT